MHERKKALNPQGKEILTLLPQGGRGPKGEVRNTPGIGPSLESQLALRLPQGTP